MCISNLPAVQSAQNSAEVNYQQLLQLSRALAQTSAFADDENVIEGLTDDIKVTVISRDLRDRPARIGLVATRIDPSSPVPGSVAIELHLYHDHELAVPLAFLENTRLHNAFDGEGRLLAAQLTELTGLLGRWLSRLLPQQRECVCA